MIAALSPGGVMQSSGLSFNMPSPDETSSNNIGSPREMSRRAARPPLPVPAQRFPPRPSQTLATKGPIVR
jgi:hypothetical protein